MTLIDERVGTQYYMAPECEAGAGVEITSSADLYSVGKLLWSAVTGGFAFAREAPVFQAKSMNTIKKFVLNTTSGQCLLTAMACTLG